MRIATVLAVASLGAVFAQDEQLARDLSSTEEQSPSLSKLFLMAMSPASTSTPKCWSPGQCCEIKSANAGDLKLGTTCNLPIPFPTDNYVSDKRVNKFDDAAVQTATDHPYVAITSTSGGTTGKVAWSAYVQNPVTMQNRIAFDTPGIYTVGISAWDYDGEASCDGCVAILDKYRPKFSGGCPVSPPTASLSTTNQATVVESGYDTAVGSSKWKNNAGSGAYCNDETNKVKHFWEGEQPLTGKCFDSNAVSYNLNKLKTNPFTAEPTYLQKYAVDLNPILNDKCRWTCNKALTLKEQYVAYSCPTTTPDPVCSGRSDASNQCTMSTTIAATGADIANSPSYTIRDNVQQASRKALTELKKDGGDVVTTVHYITPCTSLDQTDECKYKAKVSDLITVSSTLASSFPGTGANTDYVFWRYNLGGGTWKQLSPGSGITEEFAEATTVVNLQAWTACGEIGEFNFVVKLYAHSPLTCEKFSTLWSAPDIEIRGGTYCSVPGSDFSIFNLNYDFSKFIKPSADSTPEATGKYEGVTCEIKVAENDDTPAGQSPRPSVQLPFYDSNFDDLLNEDGTKPTFTKEFAVNLVNNPHTAHKTYFTVECTVSRTSYDANTAPGAVLLEENYGPDDVNSVTCPITFYLTDCEIPKLGEPSGVCTDKCAGKTNPSVYEACGGTVVTTEINAQNVVNTVVSSSDKQCCQDCSLQCNSVSTSPSRTTSIKRCDFVQSSPSPLLAAALTAEQKVFSSETTTALLGASAMVAVVALIVVKRRADAAARSQEAEDAYYPLLE